MAVFKCKMCGGALEVNNETVATCTYCGTCQTLPRLDDEKKLALFSRANNLRIKSEFDKAAGIYESIIAEFRDEAEAYWGLVLCKYGIEYVNDGAGKMIPTCHRTLPTSVMEDDDFQQACEYAEITAKNIYRDEAKAIDKIQKKILDIALSEDPYDIFICYKETDDVTGARTEDSLIAQDIYSQLLKDGYRVFFSRVSLRGVAGTEYEPYIYAALSSAKVMLAIGTKHDYYDAVWVKNEWSRFISMMVDNTEKVLIPCFRDMDAYDIPKEFKNMQALDMGDVTFFASLMESIGRIVDKTRVKSVKETIVLNNDTSDIAPLLERGFMFLEDNDWQKADEFFEAVLNKDPKNGNAYLGKLLADLEVPRFDKLSDFYTSFSGNKHYDKIMRFANSEVKESVKKANDIIVYRNEEARKKDIYDKALQMMESAKTEAMFENAGYMFLEVKEYLDAKEKSDECFEKGEIARIKAEEAEKDRIYNEACEVINSQRDSSNLYSKITALENAVIKLESLDGWRDSALIISQQRECIEQLKKSYEEKLAEIKRKDNLARAEQKKKEHRKKIIGTIVLSSIALIVLLVVFLNTIVVPFIKYNNAVEYMEAGEYHKAQDVFNSLGDYKDSVEKSRDCSKKILYRQYDENYKRAVSMMNEGKYQEALELFLQIDGFKDSNALADEAYFNFNMESLKTARIGDIICFGSYEQDNNSYNGYEEIEWVVLDIEDGKALVISKYVLDYIPFCYNRRECTWGDSTIRTWLVNDFYECAFTDAEKYKISFSDIATVNNSDKSNIVTRDTVFLLSDIEAMSYFGSNAHRLCEPSAFAKAHPRYVDFGDGASSWWLRSTGDEGVLANCVLNSGAVSTHGEYVDLEHIGVRPAMWIEIE